MGEEERRVRYIVERMREAGLTDRQVEAGLRYYRAFCRPLNINVAKCARMLVRMVKNMREYYEKLG